MPVINNHRYERKGILCINANFQLNACSQCFTNNNKITLVVSVSIVWTNKQKEVHTLNGDKKFNDTDTVPIAHFNFNKAYQKMG